VLKAFAAKLQYSLGDQPGLPKQLGLFPSDGKVPRSERFVAKEPLGYAFLHDAFWAEYRRKAASFRLVLIEGANSAECRKMLSDYVAALGPAASRAANGRYEAKDPNHGDVTLSLKGTYLCIAMHTKDKVVREAVLEEMEARLPAKE
jgi:hypothetical protein